MATWNLTGNWTGQMQVTLQGDDWNRAVDAARKRLEERSLQVGTDPAAIEKSDILNVAVNMNIQEMFTDAVRELDLSPASEAVIDIPQISSESVTVSFRFAILPEFELGDLSSLKYEEEMVSVTGADIDAEIAELKKSVETSGGKVPEDDDAFAAMLGIDGVTCMDELKGSINDALFKSRKEKAALNAQERLLDDLCALVDLKAPDGMVDMEIDSMIAADKDKVASMNGDWEEFLKSARKSEEMLKEEYREEAEKNIKVRLILEKIAQENNLYPSADEIENEYRKMAEAYGVPVEDFRSAIPEGDIIYQKSIIMAMDHLCSQKI